MSSAPSGLDVREYTYGVVLYTIVDGNNRAFRAHNKWLVTAIEITATSNAIQVAISHSGVYAVRTIPAGSTLRLEPNGSFRGQINVTELGAGPHDGAVTIEYWHQTQSNGAPLDVEIVPP